MSILRTTRILGLAVAACLSLAAKPAYLTAAKAKGIDGVTSCMSCHKTIAKDNVTFGPRGTYLRDRKKKENAAEVDVTWLKDFKG